MELEKKPVFLTKKQREELQKKEADEKAKEEQERLNEQKLQRKDFRNNYVRIGNGDRPTAQVDIPVIPGLKHTLYAISQEVKKDQGKSYKDIERYVTLLEVI